MRKPWFGLAAMAGVVLLSLLATHASQTHMERTQQHLEAPGPSYVEDGTFRTHLPIVTLETGGRPIPGMERDGSTLPAKLEIREGGTGNNALSDEAALSLTAQIRYRGNSSLHFEKKSLRLKLVDGDGQPKSVKVLGMSGEDEWILNGPFLDKSLLRNYLCMNVSGQVMEHTPEVRYCELFIDGAYQGVYLMMEGISRSTAGVSRTVEDKVETPYVVRLDRGGGLDLNHFTRYTLMSGSVLNMVYPTAQTCTPAQHAYAERDISQFEKALYSLDYNDPRLGYPHYINVESFVDYMVLNEFFQNYDAGRYSTYLSKNLGGKLTIGPVWDFNNAMDNYIETAYDATGFSFHDHLWYYMLLKDESFTHRVVSRYRTLRQGVLSDAYLQQYVDDTVAYLGDAVERNFSVWGDSFLPENGLLEPAERNIGSYEEAVDQVKDFLRRRGAWLDENIELLYQYCHPSATKKYQH